MRCPEWTFRTPASDVSGDVSGVARLVSGVSVEGVRSHGRRPLRTHGGHVGSLCPEGERPRRATDDGGEVACPLRSLRSTVRSVGLTFGLCRSRLS